MNYGTIISFIIIYSSQIFNEVKVSTKRVLLFFIQFCLESFDAVFCFRGNCIELQSNYTAPYN
ncbi:hypothetical protein T08_15460 [Trichinella sp. T8]|nr:hypothetical protein T08_6061 [Trichinella sp. T8]KRZ85291.1 hypothetical protein T08_15460 [Trichinella sp. T8]